MRAPMLTLALLLSAGVAHAETWGNFDYRRIADQNRYLVRGAEAKRPARNMEPRMEHPDQTQEAIDRLQSKGFCATGLAASCPTCKIDTAKEKSCRKPNLLIFIVDDMGWGDFGA